MQENVSNKPKDTSNAVSAEPETSNLLPVSSPKATFGITTTKPKVQTSNSAFAKSGFSALAGSTTSPFGTVGASKPSVFGGNTQTTTSGFGGLKGSALSGSTTTTTTSGFGSLAGSKPVSGFGFGNTSTSGFGALGGGSAFGSALGNGFAGGSGPKLSSFAAPGKADAPLSKPVKAFGAPESDEEDSDDEGGSDDGAQEDEERETAEEKRKTKITKGTSLSDYIYVANADLT